MDTEVGVLNDKEKYAIREYAWKKFLIGFARRSSQVDKTRPYSFESQNLLPEASFQKNTLEPANTAWELLWLHDIGRVGQKWVEEILTNKDRSKFLEFNENMVILQMDVRTKLTGLGLECVNNNLPIRESMESETERDIRLAILTELNPIRVEYLCESIGIRLRQGEQVPSTTDRPKWLYQKFENKFNNEIPEEVIKENRLSFETYSEYLDGEILSNENKREFSHTEELDSLVHALCKDRKIRMESDGRRIDLTHLKGVIERYDIEVPKIHARINNLSLRIKHALNSNDREKRVAILSAIEESIERISLEYYIRNEVEIMPTELFCDNPGLVLQNCLILTLENRKHIAQAGRLNQLWRRAMLRNQQNRWGKDRQLNEARTILGTEKNFILWKTGTEPERLNPIQAKDIG